MTQILIVEDTAELKGVYVQLAQRCDRVVRTADSGAEAQRMIETESFDVVVTDLKMEQRNAGLEVLRAAKQKDPLAQVIVATVFGTPEISIKVMELGAFDYLQRNAAAVDFFQMLRYKIDLAVRYRRALLAEAELTRAV